MTNQNQNHNQNAGPGDRDDEIDSVIDMLRAAAGDESIPDDVSGLDSGNEASKGPAAHKFAEQQKRLKQAVSVIEQQRQKMADLTSSSQKGSGEEGTNTNRGSKSNQEEAIYRALSMQACQNLGINSREEAPRVFDLELGRLWNDNAQRIENQRKAKETAPEFVENALSQYDQLGDQDRSTVKQRLQRLDVLQQVDPNVVRREVASYLGEKALSGQPIGGGNDSGGSHNDGEGTVNGPPVGDTKHRGSSGVRPGSRAPRKQEEQRPATPEEAKEMKKLGIQDLGAYRAAKQKTENYRGR